MDGPPRVGRVAKPWTECFRDPNGYALWVQGPSEEWVGRPWSGLTGAEGRVWLVGSVGADSEVLRNVAFAEGDPAVLGVGFQVISYDRSRGWRLITDRFGTMHAYRGPSCAGSSWWAVCERSERSLDTLGIAGFFSHGFFPADRTYFEDVRVVGPARRCSLDVGSWDEGRRYWHWRHRPDPDRSYRRTLDQFIDLFRGLMSEIDRGDLAIPISGGLDSRLTVAALVGRRAGRRAYSYGYGEGSVETRIARRVATRRDLPFESWAIRPYLLDQMPRVLAAVEGFHDLTQSRQVFVAPWLRRHGASVVAAHWGDVWLDDMAWHRRPDPKVGPVGFLLSRLEKRGRQWLLNHFGATPLGVSEDLRAWVSDGLSRYSEIDDPDFKIKAFKTDHWSFRWTLAGLRAYEMGATPKLPFYDPRLADFFATVPTSFVARRRLQIDAIKCLAPELARITWQAYDASLYTWHLTGSLHLPKRALKKVWRTLSGRRPRLRNWEVQLLPESQFERLRDVLSAPGSAVLDGFERSDIETLLQDFRARPDAASGYTVSMLLTFAQVMEASRPGAWPLGAPR